MANKKHMGSNINRQFYLHQRPKGIPISEDVRYRETNIPQPEHNQVVVRNYYLSLDPAIRGWMDTTPNYMPPIEQGKAITASTVGQMIASENSNFSVGDFVYGLNAWEDYSLSNSKGLLKIPEDSPYPLYYYLNILGAVGMTAYFGVSEVGAVSSGKTLLMSAAAGAVGSVGGQIGKILGCRVVGSAGSDDKCRWITDELGFDAAINYKTCDNLADAIGAACPEGIDVYFDNVGGEILDAALLHLNDYARIVFCGSIANYNSETPVPGPYNYWQVLALSATVHGYVVTRYFKRFPEGAEKSLHGLARTGYSSVRKLYRVWKIPF